MRSADGESPLDLLQAGLAGLGELDVAGLADEQVRAGVLALLEAGNAISALLAAWTRSFDLRALADADGFRSSGAWLQAFGRVSPHTASGIVKRGRLLADLPQLAEGARGGQVSPEHLRRVDDLVGRIGVDNVAPFDQILAELAVQANPADVSVACEHIRAYVDPDGPDPDPHAHDRRGITLARQGSLMILRGQLDPEGGAILATALDALMRPPIAGEPATAAQRRADALVDLARLGLASDTLPTVEGARPQVGLILYPDQWQHAQQWLRDHHHDSDDDHDSGEADEPCQREEPAEPAGTRQPQAQTDEGDRQCHSHADTAATAGTRSTQPLSAVQQALARAGIAPTRPPWLDWFGEIGKDTAERIACNCDIWRAVIDPVTSQPLDVGRAHRLAPPWLRKALHVRDRGCRWPGCTVPSQWTDAHHRRTWLNDGLTEIDNLVLLCRTHQMKVHEGHWRLDFDPATGIVTIHRPNGRPYELGPSYPRTATARSGRQGGSGPG